MRLLGSAALQRGSPEAGARRGAQGGSIVFVSSYTAYRAEAPIALYAVSKTALVALSKALAEELGPAGIRVNCVAPAAAPAPAPDCPAARPACRACACWSGWPWAPCDAPDVPAAALRFSNLACCAP